MFNSVRCHGTFPRVIPLLDTPLHVGILGALCYPQLLPPNLFSFQLVCSFEVYIEV